VFVTTVRVLSLNLFSKSRFSSLHLSAFACNLNMHRGHTSCVWNCSLRDFSKSYFGFSSFYLTLVTRAFGLIEWMYVNYVTSISCQITLTCNSPAMPSRRLVAEMPGIRRGLVDRVWACRCGQTAYPAACRATRIKLLLPTTVKTQPGFSSVTDRNVFEMTEKKMISVRMSENMG